MKEIAEIQVSYRPRMMDLVQVSSSEDAYTLAINLWNKDTISLYEEFKLILLNRNNRVIAFYPVSKGGISGTVVDIRLILAVALKTASSSIVLVHNHPSGNLHPSDQDIIMTKKVKEASQLMDIRVLDHLIVTDSGYYSFADEGFL